ncbi:unnamed protein product [Gemmataceae bacterium]|nr:unnamed protein product [Gemmataceae bacterium]VTU00258.1 unnamed protein product [Gemmataceae bacterium]
MTRRRKRLIAAAVALPLVTYLVRAGCVRFNRESVQANTLVGRTEGEVRRSYGQPDEDWSGYHPLALDVPRTLPPGPIRTLVFAPRGLLHPEGGTLWVWVAERDGEWVCFESCWFADGVVY